MKIKVCRLCLQADGPLEKLSSLTCGTSSNGTDMMILIKQYINIELHCSNQSFDSVEIMLCIDCQNVIEGWDKFQKSCISNDEIFRKMVTNIVRCACDTADMLECNKDAHNWSFNEPEADSPAISDITEEELNTVVMLEDGETDHLSLEDPIREDVKQKRLERPKSRKKENGDIRAGICTVCGELRKNIYEHMKTHNANRPYACPHCPLSFRNASNCKSHINIHTKEKVYKCDMCGKEYAMRNGLKQHLATHAKNLDYLCHCGKSFYQRTAYARHARKHVEKPKVKCSECSMLFFSNAEMRYHSQKHKGATFHCEICGRGFYRKSNLKKHELLHRTLHSDADIKTNLDISSGSNKRN